MECIPFDQSESRFFNRNLDQIADQLEQNSTADLFSHGSPWVEVTLRLLVSGSCNQTIKNAIDKSIDQMERTI